MMVHDICARQGFGGECLLLDNCVAGGDFRHVFRQGT